MDMPTELLAEREYRIMTEAAVFAARDMTVYTFLPGPTYNLE
jgi:hypothetical protein